MVWHWVCKYGSESVPTCPLYYTHLKKKGKINHQSFDNPYTNTHLHNHALQGLQIRPAVLDLPQRDGAEGGVGDGDAFVCLGFVLCVYACICLGWVYIFRLSCVCICMHLSTQNTLLIAFSHVLYI